MNPIQQAIAGESKEMDLAGIALSDTILVVKRVVKPTTKDLIAALCLCIVGEISQVVEENCPYNDRSKAMSLMFKQVAETFDSMSKGSSGMHPEDLTL